MTNAPDLWPKVSLDECLVRSDHAAVVVNPRTVSKAVRKNVVFRGVRDQPKLQCPVHLRITAGKKLYQVKILLKKRNFWKTH